MIPVVITFACHSLNDPGSGPPFNFTCVRFRFQSALSVAIIRARQKDRQFLLGFVLEPAGCRTSCTPGPGILSAGGKETHSRISGIHTCYGFRKNGIVSRRALVGYSPMRFVPWLSPLLSAYQVIPPIARSLNRPARKSLMTRLTSPVTKGMTWVS